LCSAADRDPVPFLPLDPGWVKSQDPDPMNNQDHISESLETISWVKIRNSFMQIRDPESGMEKKSDPGWKKFGSGMEKIQISD
jgi:hypothetical protein